METESFLSFRFEAAILELPVHPNQDVLCISIIFRKSMKSHQNVSFSTSAAELQRGLNNSIITLNWRAVASDKFLTTLYQMCSRSYSKKC
jgi:hypothetical protein